VEQGVASLEGYAVVELILGKQRSCLMGRGTSGVDFQLFSKELQAKVSRYVSGGGALFASGCYVASDLWNGANADAKDKEFARKVLHINYNGDMATRRGVARVVASPMKMARQNINFNREPSRDFYAVESPGCISPSGKGAFIAMRYASNNQSAAVGYNGEDYRSMIMAFPFESIMSESERHSLMRGVLNFLSEKKAE
jgi:hypothetical protein